MENKSVTINEFISHFNNAMQRDDKDLYELVILMLVLQLLQEKLGVNDEKN